MATILAIPERANSTKAGAIVVQAFKGVDAEPSGEPYVLIAFADADSLGQFSAEICMSPAEARAIAHVINAEAQALMEDSTKEETEE